MSENTIRWDQDADGIVTLTLDDPNQRANTMNDDFRTSLASTVDRPTERIDQSSSPSTNTKRSPSSRNALLTAQRWHTPLESGWCAPGWTKVHGRQTVWLRKWRRRFLRAKT